MVPSSYLPVFLFCARLRVRASGLVVLGGTDRNFLPVGEERQSSAGSWTFRSWSHASIASLRKRRWPDPDAAELRMSVDEGRPYAQEVADLSDRQQPLRSVGPRLAGPLPFDPGEAFAHSSLAFRQAILRPLPTDYGRAN